MSEYESRVKKLQSYLSRKDLSALVLHGDANENGTIRWISNFEPLVGSTFVIVPAEGDPILVSDSVLHGEPMHSLWWMTWIKDLRESKFGMENLVATVASVLREKVIPNSSGGVRIGYVGDYSFPLSLLAATLPKAQLLNCREDIASIKMPKSREEISIMRQTTAIASKAMIAGCEAISEGVSESTVVGVINQVMFEEGAHDVAFYTMALSGKRTHLKHSPPLGRKMRRGDMVFIDLGSSVFGYYSDLCRTLTVGKPSDTQLQILDAALAIHARSSKLLREGVPTAEVAENALLLAREFRLERECHVDGHGIGTSMFDPPSIGAHSEGKLEASTTLAYEPMIFSKRFGTVSFEDDYLIKRAGGGAELLTNCPRTFF